MALHWATRACQWRYTELHVHVIGLHVNKGTHLVLFGHDLLSLKPLSDFLQLVLLLLDLSLQFHFHTLMFSNLHPHLFNLATILLGRALRCREVILNQSSSQVSSFIIENLKVYNAFIKFKNSETLNGSTDDCLLYIFIELKSEHFL